MAGVSSDLLSSQVPGPRGQQLWREKCRETSIAQYSPGASGPTWQWTMGSETTARVTVIQRKLCICDVYNGFGENWLLGWTSTHYILIIYEV